MTQPNRLTDALKQMQERSAAGRQANRNYLSILKSLEVLGISPYIQDGNLIVSMDELIRKEYEYMTGVDLATYANANGHTHEELPEEGN